MASSVFGCRFPSDVRHVFVGACGHCFHLEDVWVEIALCLYCRVFSNTWVPTWCLRRQWVRRTFPDGETALRKMMADIVTVCASFGLTVCFGRAEPQDGGHMPDDEAYGQGHFVTEAAGQMYEQTSKFV